MKKNFIFTSESVTEGHPDKLCDQISDAVVDHFLEQDPRSKVRVECAVATAILFIASRFASKAVVDFANVARKVIKNIGYEHGDFNEKTCSILTSLKELPADAYYDFDVESLTEEEIERIPVRHLDTVFGFACNQTQALMPLPIWLAHQLSRKITFVRRKKILPYLASDGKTQVGIEYRERKPYRIHSITIITSQKEGSAIGLEKLDEDIRGAVIESVFADEVIQPDANTNIFINPMGPIMVGGPSVHSGLTGRKNAVDTYGEYSRYGGSALSGKDPMRIDRVGAYAARYAAKNVVAAGLADECEVQLTYAIGFSRPVSIQVETFETGAIADDDIAALLERHFDFRIAGIVKQFNMRRLPTLHKGGFYQQLAAYGHVGRTDIELPWESMDKVEALRRELPQGKSRRQRCETSG